MNYLILTKHKRLIDERGGLPGTIAQKVAQWLRTEFVYTSYTFEGGTLSRDEVATVLEKRTTIAGRPLAVARDEWCA